MTSAVANLAQPRILAWLIDMALALGFGIMLGPSGWVVSTAYWLLRDGLFEGQSIGNRLMGLKVVIGAARRRCGFGASTMRNLLWVVPLANLLMACTGIYHLSRDRAGRHWGDRLADTRVVKASAS